MLISTHHQASSVSLHSRHSVTHWQVSLPRALWPQVCDSHYGALVCSSEAYGAKGCCGNSNAGCCGSCCNSSFDEDAFDVQAQKDRKEAEGTDAQLAPQVQMSAIKLKPQPEDAGSLIIAKAEDT